MLAVIDAKSGKVLAAPPIGIGASGVVFDSMLGLAKCANGKSGTLSVIKEATPGVFETVQTLKTSISARHATFDAKTHRFFLECDLPGADVHSFEVMVVAPEMPQ